LPCATLSLSCLGLVFTCSGRHASQDLGQVTNNRTYESNPRLQPGVFCTCIVLC
jgi:hypothetical protein